MTSPWTDRLTQVAVCAAGAATAVCVAVAALHPVTFWSAIMLPGRPGQRV